MGYIPEQNISIRKGPLYFIAAVFIGFLFILYDDGKIHEGASIAALIGILVFAIIYYMLSKNKTIIDNNGISQQLFFGKKKTINWTDIKSSSLGWKFHGHGSTLEWNIISATGKPINFQPHFFSRKNLQLIAEAIVDKCPNAVIDQRIQNIAASKFPWYIF